ncbi:MAG: sortase [Candidatus Limnocylindria bacterium]
MITGERRLTWLASALTLTVLFAGWLTLASGILTPAPSTSPVALETAGAGGGRAGVQPSPSMGPTPSSTATVPEGTVADRIVIPRLEVDLPIYEGDGYTAELGKAAHYPTTTWPGGGSLIYLYSHARDDNFIALWDAEVGDRIDLELEDGSTAQYRVSRIDEDVAWNDLTMLEPTPAELLRLQTCNSDDPTAPRFIVEAVPVQSGRS